MIGPIMLDVHGTSLSAEDKDILNHPLVGGVILFSRNYQEPGQIQQLVADMRRASKQPLLLAVDHEGGRVQRFREGFSSLPAMANIWQAAEGDVARAAMLAEQTGRLMAMEVLALGIDISFAPVLDVNGISEVIGDRAFHQDPEVVTALGSAFVAGMHSVGMKATGKHFPGHGSVKEDSHIALPIDKREQTQIFAYDLLPFKRLIEENVVDALMPAHIIFPAVDQQAVGFSRLWLQQVLRQQLHFDGVIFSDDLTMQGAAYIGGFSERAEAAQQAGCDMLLVCNHRAAAIEIIDRANIQLTAASAARLAKLRSSQQWQWTELAKQPYWQQARAQLTRYHLL